MHIEFTKLPDPDRDRRNVRAQVLSQIRRRLWLIIATCAVLAFLGIREMSKGDRQLGASVLAIAVVYLAWLAFRFQSQVSRQYRRLAELGDAAMVITITEIDISFSKPWNYTSWAWAGIDFVADLGRVLVGYRGDAPAFAIALECMLPDQEPELRAFLAARRLLATRSRDNPNPATRAARR
jgi:hypothetical protein